MSTLGQAPAAAPTGATIHAAMTLIWFMAASSAPTPLYRLYQEAWGFSPSVLTLIFAVYAFSLLLALLTVGSLSDHIGRRPAIFAALCLEIGAMALFLAARDVGWLIAARILQGFATGLATTSLSAALLDANRVQGPLINSLVPPLGMAIGALGVSLLAEYAPWPTRLSYGGLIALFALQAALVWRSPETAGGRPGAWASLRPRIVIPAGVIRPLLRITPANIAIWALGGFSLSLMPSLVRVTTGASSAVAGGSMVAAMTLSGAGAILALQGVKAARVLALGSGALALGVAVVLAGAHGGQASVLLAGIIIAGFGWGGAFLGGLRTVLPLVDAGERAGFMSAYYLQSYLAMSLPALLAGYGARDFGLLAATDIYGVVLIILALIAVVLARRDAAILAPMAPARLCPAPPSPSRPSV